MNLKIIKGNRRSSLTWNNVGSDLSNFIKNDQNAGPSQLAVLWVMTPKFDFLLIGADTQGIHEHSKFWKNFTAPWVKLQTTKK